jgi:hypothetical protein
VWLAGVLSFFVFISSLGVLHLMLAVTLGAGFGAAILVQDRYSARIAHILVALLVGLSSLGLLVLSTYLGWWAFGVAVLAVTLVGHLGMRAARRDIMRVVASWRAKRKTTL